MHTITLKSTVKLINPSMKFKTKLKIWKQLKHIQTSRAIYSGASWIIYSGTSQIFPVERYKALTI